MERVRVWLVVLVGIAAVGLVNLWVLKSELIIGGASIIGGNPPLPALMVMLLLLGFRRLLSEKVLNRREILTLHTFLCIALPIGSFGVMRAFLPCLTSPFYFATPENRLERFFNHIPEWFVPKDMEVLRAYYEGAETGWVPWSAWALPLTLWAVFFLAVFVFVLCMVVLVHRQWIEHERLTFPLLYLPTRMVRGEVNFFVDPVMWVGFGTAFILNLLNILNSFFPSILTIPRVYDLGALFTERPLNAVRPLLIYQLLEGVGFGYLVSQDLLFTIWFFYLVLKLMAIGGAIIGYQPPDFPFPHEQSVGGYLAMALLLLWGAFRHWKARLMSYPTALVGLLVASVFLLAWCSAAGMSLSAAALYFAVLFLFALTYARIRGEAGMPYTWVYPYGAQREFLYYTFGARGLLRLGGERSLTLLSTLWWLSRHYYPNIMSAYSIDNIKLAQQEDLNVARITKLMLIAVPVGVVWAYWSHLRAYYGIGANLVEGATGQADYRTWVALSDYITLYRRLNPLMPPDWTRVAFTAYGFVITFLLWLVRSIVLRSPLHPLGFPIAYAYSHHCPYWFPTFLVWALKTAIFYIGGIRLYRRLIPAFMGLALGHFFTGGILWGGIVSPMLASRIMTRYRVVFE